MPSEGFEFATRPCDGLPHQKRDFIERTYCIMSDEPEQFGWGDRVVDLRKNRHRGRLGTYRSQCHPDVGADAHNIKWEGCKTAERVRSGKHFGRAPADLPIPLTRADRIIELLEEILQKVSNPSPVTTRMSADDAYFMRRPR